MTVVTLRHTLGQASEKLANGEAESDALALAAGRDAIDEVIAKRRLRFRFMRHDSWENALFVHWPVDPACLAALLPAGLEPDVLDGCAWVGLVLLTERGVSAYHSVGRLAVPPIDHYGANVRTYVRHNGVPGIFFFSLECSSAVASLGARLAGIPYFPARMRRTVDVERPVARPAGAPSPGCAAGCGGAARLRPRAPEGGNGCAEDGFVFEFASTRSGWRQETPGVAARWRLAGPEAADGAAGLDDGGKDTFATRATWFLERYSVYAAWPWGRGPVLLRGDVQHPPWAVQRVVVEDLDADSLFAAAGLAGARDVEAAPHACFSRGVGPVDFWMLEPV